MHKLDFVGIINANINVVRTLFAVLFFVCFD